MGRQTRVKEDRQIYMPRPAQSAAMPSKFWLNFRLNGRTNRGQSHDEIPEIMQKTRNISSSAFKCGNLLVRFISHRILGGFIVDCSAKVFVFIALKKSQFDAFMSWPFVTSFWPIHDH
jgi:hypothetical protein